jgi:heme A synthase
MQIIHRGAWVTSVLTYFLISLGGTALATGSGLSCPDWPFCYGQAYYAGTYHAFLEQLPSSKTLAFEATSGLAGVDSNRAL